MTVVDVLITERAREAHSAHAIGAVKVRYARGAVQTRYVRAVVDEPVAVVASPAGIARTSLKNNSKKVS